MKSRPVISWLCALLLVFAQHAGWAHGLDHLSSGQGGEDPSLPHNFKVCEQCHQMSQLGAGLVPKALVFTCDATFARPQARVDSVFESVSVPPFSSRAPPVVL